MTQRLGLLILVLGLASCGGGSTTSGAAGGAAGLQPSASGNMFPFSIDRAWTYQTVNASSPYTVTLHANNNNASSTSTLSAFVVAGIQPDAISKAPESSIVESMALQPTAGSFQVLSVARTRNGSFAIPGSPELVPDTLTQGASFSPYVGVSADVRFVGGVRGAEACSSRASGATVRYAFQQETFTVSYVPGCGITDFVSNTGVELRLISISSYHTAAIEAAERSISGTTLLDTIRDVTNALFRR